MSVILETNRLCLRPMTLDDLDAVADLYADPEVMRYIGPPRTREDSRGALLKLIDCQEKYGFSLWATVEKASGALIGRCGLHYYAIDGTEELEVAYMLARFVWGLGLGKEVALAIRDYAFRELPVGKVVSCIDHGNIASKRVAEAMGMTHEKDAWDEFGSFSVFSLSRARWEVDQATRPSE